MITLEPYGPEHEALRNDPESGPIFPAIANGLVLTQRRAGAGLLGWAALIVLDGCPMICAAARTPWAALALQRVIDQVAAARGIKRYVVEAATPTMKRIFPRMPGWDPISESWFGHDVAGVWSVAR